MTPCAHHVVCHLPAYRWSSIVWMVRVLLPIFVWLLDAKLDLRTWLQWIHVMLPRVRRLLVTGLSITSIRILTWCAPSLPTKVAVVVANAAFLHLDVVLLANVSTAPILVWANSMRFDVVVSYALICWACNHILRIGRVRLTCTRLL